MKDAKVNHMRASCRIEERIQLGYIYLYKTCSIMQGRIQDPARVDSTPANLKYS
jgi:hypothetical protein